MNTPASNQRLIRKYWKLNLCERSAFHEIIDDISNSDHDEDELRIKSMDNFPCFDPKTKKKVLNSKYEYEICDIAGDANNVENLVRIHMTIQPEEMLHIFKYYRFDDKIVLIIEKSSKLTFELYSEQIGESVQRKEKYVSEFITLFELYHKNGFPSVHSLKRLFFRDEN